VEEEATAPAARGGGSGDFGGVEGQGWEGQERGRRYLLGRGGGGTRHRTMRDGRSGFDLAAVCLCWWRFLEEKDAARIILFSPARLC
jgi:hypothetical protein